MRMKPYLAILFLLALPAPMGAGAASLSNNGVIAGNWTGTSEPDTMTNQVSGSVGTSIIANDNTLASSSGGENQVHNYGYVEDDIIGSRNGGAGAGGGSNTITNHSQGSSWGEITGSSNLGAGSTGGGNTILNNGTVFLGILGSHNSGAGASGGGNTITNNHRALGGVTGTMNSGGGASGGGNTIVNNGDSLSGIAGTWNAALNASGGDNIIVNNGQAGPIYGTYNEIDGVLSGGGNSITNNGSATEGIYGTCNLGDGTSGGGNTITNSGSVTGDIIGSYNDGDNTSGGGNTITNNGSVDGGIYGTRNTGAGSSSGGAGNTITNNGPVGGGIYAGDANDTVYILSGSSVGAVVDGQAGTDSLYLGASGNIDSSAMGTAYLNFENLGLYVNGQTSLTGNWVLNLGSTITSGGNLTVNNTLRGVTLDNAGTAAFNGDTSFSGAVTNSGHLSVGDWLSAGSLSNTGTTVVSGGLRTGSLQNQGRLEISGTVISGYTYNSGTAVLNGSLFGGINNHGNLSGSGTLHGDLSNAGSLSPGNSIGTLSIKGVFTNLPGSTYFCDLSYADGSSDLISAERAVLQGGTVVVNVIDGFSAADHRWTVLTTTGGISGEFDSVNTPGSAILTLKLIYTDTTVSVVLTRASYANFAATANERSVGRALDAIAPLAAANNDDMADLLRRVDYGFSAAEINDLLAACNPEMYDAFSYAALNTARRFDGIMARRNDEQRLSRALGAAQPKTSGPVGTASEGAPGLSAPHEPMGRWSMWAKAMGDWAQRNSDQVAGYDLKTGGMVLGVDGPLLPWLRVGLAFGMSDSDMAWDRSGHDGDQRAINIGLSAAFEKNGFWADGGLSYGSYDNSATRNLSFHDSSSQAQSDYDSKTWLARLGGGYDCKLGDCLLGPTASLSYVNLEEDGFAERGADFLGLSVDGRNVNYWSGSLGLRAAARYDLKQLTLLPRLALAWRHQLDSGARGLSAAFRDYTSTRFTVYGLEPDQDALDLQLGLTAAMGRNFNMFVTYSLLWAGETSDQGLSAGLNWQF